MESANLKWALLSGTDQLVIRAALHILLSILRGEPEVPVLSLDQASWEEKQALRYLTRELDERLFDQ